MQKTLRGGGLFVRKGGFCGFQAEKWGFWHFSHDAAAFRGAGKGTAAGAAGIFGVGKGTAAGAAGIFGVGTGTAAGAAGIFGVKKGTAAGAGRASHGGGEGCSCLLILVS